MQKGDVLRTWAVAAPALVLFGVELIDRQQRRHAGVARQGQLAQGRQQLCGGEDQPRLGVVDDRQQALQVLRAHRLRRIGRHGDDTGMQAGEKCRDVVRATGQQQQRTLARLGTLCQGGSHDAGALVELAVGEHLAVVTVAIEEAQGRFIRPCCGMTQQCVSQRSRAFEEVGHRGTCPHFHGCETADQERATVFSWR